MQIVEVARANFIPTVSMEIKSPVNEKTYEPTPLLVVAVNFYAWGNRSRFVVYSVDGSANNTLTGNLVNIDEISSFTGSTALPKLSAGEHCINVCAWVDVENNSGFRDKFSSEITFYVNNKETPNRSLPRVEILSPENNTCNDAEISLELTVNTSTSWVGYSLDNQSNITLTGNSTLTGLAEGSHNLIIYANDTLGNMGKSETVYFTIAESFPTATVAAVSAAVAVVVVAGLLVYHKKHKRGLVAV